MTFERYRRDVLERLHRYQRRGLGRVMELCTIKDNGDSVPMAGFRTNGETVALVTARHHSCDTYCTDESVYRMIEGGVTGFVAVPVVDVSSYDVAQNTLDRWSRVHPEDAPSFLEEIFRERGRPDWSGVPIRDWDHWRYGHRVAPPETRAVEGIFGEYPLRLVMDVHGCRAEYIFIKKPVEADCGHIEKAMLRALKSNGGEVHTGDANLCLSPSDTPGFFLYHGPKGDILTFSADSGIPNYAVDVPFFRYDGESLKLRKSGRLIKTSAAVMAAAIESVKK